MTVENKFTKISLNTEDNLQLIGLDLVSYSDKVCLAATVINNSQDTIKSISYDVEFLDEDGKALFNGKFFNFELKNLKLKPKSQKELPFIEIDSKFREAKILNVKLNSWTLEDSSSVAAKSPNFNFSSQALDIEESTYLRGKVGPKAHSFSELIQDNWRCVCGFVNDKETSSCNYCNRNRDFVLSNMSRESYLNVGKRPSVGIPANTPKKKRPKASFNISRIFPFIGGFLVLVVLALLFKKGIGPKFSEAKANKLAEEGNYQEAIKKYESLGKKDYANEIAEIKNLIQLNEEIDRALELKEKGELLEALKILKSIDDDNGKVSERAMLEFEDIENSLIGKIENALETNNKNEAKSLIQDFLSFDPDNQEILKLRGELAQLEEVKTEEKPKEEAKKDEEKDEALSPEEANKKLEGMDENTPLDQLAEALIGSEQVILTSMANMRTEANLDSGVVAKVNGQSKMIVSETMIEDNKRVWCYGELTDSKTGQTYSGWISTKVLGY